jgi:hypothetical protein
MRGFGLESRRESRLERRKMKNLCATELEEMPPEKAKPWATVGRKATDPEIAFAVSARRLRLIKKMS